MDSTKKKKNYYLTRIFGNSVNVKIIEILLNNAIAEQKSGKVLWYNYSIIIISSNIFTTDNRYYFRDKRNSEKRER